MTPELLRRLPKAELHVHLDGSLRPATMLSLAAEQGQALPATSAGALADYMLVSDARNLDEYLARFELTIALLQTPEAIERVAYEMMEDAAADGVRYVEIRYCPWLSLREGLSLDDVTDAEWRGVSRGAAAFGITGRLIHCGLRQLDPDISLAIAEHAVASQDRGVVAFDLAGSEMGHPPGDHASAFDAAVHGGLAVTVHAGEAAGAHSIAEAVHRCHASRIGHGTRLYEDPVLEAYIRDRRIALEVNITSNVQTRAVESAAAHPVRRYLDAGLAVTLSTDSWLMSGVSLSGEYWNAHQQLGFTRAEVDQMILHGFRSAFLPWPERSALVEEVASVLEATV